MALKITKVDVWAVEIRDEPGGLAGILNTLSEAGVNLDCVIARRQADKFQAGVVFVSPVKGRRAQAAAERMGLSRAEDLATLRVEGPDTPGLGSRMTRAVAEAGINVRGVSAMSNGHTFISYFGFDSSTDADGAARALKGIGRGRVTASPARRTRARTTRGAAR